MRWITFMLVVAAASAGIGFVVGAQDAPEQPSEKKLATLKTNEVARVHTSIVSAEQLLARIAFLDSLRRPDQRIVKVSLDSLVLERVLDLEAERIEVRIKQHEVKAEAVVQSRVERNLFDQINADLVRQQKSEGQEPKPYTWEQFLKERLKTTPEAFQKAIEKRAKAIIKKRLVVGYLEISTEHAEASGLMLDTEKSALEIRKKILDGPQTLGSFAVRASSDTKTRKHKGKIGTIWPGDGRLDTEVDKAFTNLKKGELSMPIKTAHGWWLVRKDAIYLANEQPFYEQRAGLMKAANISDNRFKAWANAIAASKRYTYERRLPYTDYSLETK